MDEFDISKLTPRAQQVMSLALKEAQRLKQHLIKTEHLLFGLLKLGQGCGWTVLQMMVPDTQALGGELEKLIITGHVSESGGKIAYSPRVGKVLFLAAEEAHSMGHAFVGTEHFLLGILREGDGVAAELLLGMGANFETARELTFQQFEISGKNSPNLNILGEKGGNRDELITKPLQIATTLLLISAEILPEKIKADLLELQVAVLLEVCESPEDHGALAEGILIKIMNYVLSRTDGLTVFRTVAPILVNLLGTRDKATEFVQALFRKSERGSLKERRWGIVLQLLTGRPVTKTFNFLP